MQVWMCPHPPKRGATWLGTRPKVHTGFYRAWTANGLHTEIIQYLQVLPPPNVQGYAVLAAALVAGVWGGGGSCQAAQRQAQAAPSAICPSQTVCQDDEVQPVSSTFADFEQQM